MRTVNALVPGPREAAFIIASLSPFFSPLLPLFSHVLIWMFGYVLLLSFVLHNMPICEPLFFLYVFIIYRRDFTGL